MSVMEKPIITPLLAKGTNKTDGKQFTRISFIPDLSKFKCNEKSIDQGHLSLFYRRVFDLAGTVKGISVFLNGKKIPISSFSSYARMYVESCAFGRGEPIESPLPLFHITVNDRWDVAVASSEEQFQQVSFVNSIHTSKGGTHVSLITDQLVSAISDALVKKNKGMSIKPFQVKSRLWVFVNCLIENPTFDSQTKETLTLRAAAFGSECQLPASFLTKIINNSGIVAMLQAEFLAAAKAKEDKELKKTDGRKSARLSGIPKLDDANFAGTKSASKCTLILTEGDSAKALAVSGLSVVGRDYFGVYPLRGKLLNVRDANENVEISAIKQILGLQHGRVYANNDALRYGRIMLMTDQDHDGSHIKGLLINFIDFFWPSLLKLPSGFLTAFITPIVVVTPKNRNSRPNRQISGVGIGARIDSTTGAISFYTIPEYENWKTIQTTHSLSLFLIKYYKGLGTSTSADAKKYFSSMNLHAKPFVSMTKADARKEWLHAFVPGTFLDCSTPQFTIEDFVQRELILFSMADNVRSIPSVIDGLKPGLRKILFSCFKRKLKQEIKVAQLAGYVSEHAAYHHGEASLCASIIGLAQDYTGSNNIPLLVPSGQFGTRLQGGKDAASPRYIFTCLSEISRLIFMESDDDLLVYLNDDGQSIEPEWYMPIIPMLLVNGSEGIGTGWSTFIPPFSPLEVIENVLRKIEEKPLVEMHPWYRCFSGSILCSESMGYKIYGKANLRYVCTDWVLNITELPVGVWTQNYKEFLESLIERSPALVKEFTEHHTDTCVSFSIKLGEAAIESAEAILDPHLVPSTNIATESFLKLFKLSSSISLTNMVAFDAGGHLKRYGSALEILEDWYLVRLNGYHRRKENLVSHLSREWKRLDAKMRFISEILQGTLVIARKSKADLVRELSEKGYEEDENGGGYDYLLGMPLWSLTAERILQLENERKEKEDELKLLLSKTPCDLWKTDLMTLKKFVSSSEYYSDHIGVRADVASQQIAYTEGEKPMKIIKLEQKEDPLRESKEPKETEKKPIPRNAKTSAHKKTSKPMQAKESKSMQAKKTKSLELNRAIGMVSSSESNPPTELTASASDPSITNQVPSPRTNNNSLLDRIQTMLSSSNISSAQATLSSPGINLAVNQSQHAATNVLPKTQRKPAKKSGSNSRDAGKSQLTLDISPVIRKPSSAKNILRRGIIKDDSSENESIASTDGEDPFHGSTEN
uniref:DNA topoisomerase 2 n=1 Tax=Mitosporidium daphniae TaxID=1485682 RepID=A0A098VQW0_9MICR